jgi:hypothetical protein
MLIGCVLHGAVTKRYCHQPNISALAPNATSAGVLPTIIFAKLPHFVARPLRMASSRLQRLNPFRRGRKEAVFHYPPFLLS